MATYLDQAIATVPRYGDRISLFTKKLRLAQYADSTIYSYRLKISQAVLYLKKIPDSFTQADIERYLSMLLDRNRYSNSFFKHTIFGLKDYYNVMGLMEPKGLVLQESAKPSGFHECSLSSKLQFFSIGVNCMTRRCLPPSMTVLSCAVNTIFYIIFDQF